MDYKQKWILFKIIFYSIWGLVIFCDYSLEIFMLYSVIYLGGIYGLMGEWYYPEYY